MKKIQFFIYLEMNISSWTRNRQQGKPYRLRRKGGKSVLVGGNQFLPDGRFKYCQTLVKHTGCVNALGLIFDKSNPRL